MWPKTKVVVVRVASFLCDDPTTWLPSLCGLSAFPRRLLLSSSNSEKQAGEISVLQCMYNTIIGHTNAEHIYETLSRTYKYSEAESDQMSSAAFTGISSLNKVMSMAVG